MYPLQRYHISYFILTSVLVSVLYYEHLECMGVDCTRDFTVIVIEGIQ